MTVLVRPAPLWATLSARHAIARRSFSSYRPLAVAPRRSNNFSSGFSSSYDPTTETGRGPIFSSSSVGVPQFYPRDLKKRVDDYVVGQDRAKKTICSVIFNHYQGLRRRQHFEFKEQRLREKKQRQRYVRDKDMLERYRDQDTMHPVEGMRHGTEPLAKARAVRECKLTSHLDEFPGHNESVRNLQPPLEEPPVDNFYVPEDVDIVQHVKIDKSNLLLIGPTGVGKTYILEYAAPGPPLTCCFLTDP